ncbi:MAG: IS5 family transposase [Balneolaceae bacterium]|nr:IS5 family transposase [Balneolaceae bacterium]
MINYTSQYQTQFEDFSNLCQLELDPNNRWIQLGALLPWDRMVGVYAKRFSPNMGAVAVNPRWVIGAFIIKHKLRLSDEETLLSISENPYMQFFLGLETFHPTQLFSPTLFVELRKRLGEDTFDEFSRTLITLSEDLPSASSAGNNSKPAVKGKLKIDATVADQYIRYPTDLSLVNEARIKTEMIIDLLWEKLKDQLPVKPRTYRKVAHKRYLSQSKKKNASKASLRKTLRYLLNCVERNLGHIEQMLDMAGGQAFPLSHKYQRQLWIIHTLYEQQRGMYDERTRRCEDRIVSISQPHVRPILRGKSGKRVEFGAKLGLSLFGGYLTHQTISWDAYNEASDLQHQAETYRLLTGHYPELIQCDKIYHTNDNRTWCSQRGIRMTALPKGPKPKLSAYEKRKQRDEYAERNHIEGRIGNAKQGLSLNQIKAKLQSTSETWIAATLFVLNLSAFAARSGVTF